MSCCQAKVQQRYFFTFFIFFAKYGIGLMVMTNTDLDKISLEYTKF